MKQTIGFHRGIFFLSLLFLGSLLVLPQSSCAKENKFCNSYWENQFTQIKIQQLEKIVDQLEIQPNNWAWRQACRSDGKDKIALYKDAQQLVTDIRLWHDTCYYKIKPREVIYKLWDRWLPARDDIDFYKNYCMRE